MVSSTGLIFNGFAVPSSGLCAKASRDMISISVRQSHSLDSFLLILRTLAITWPQGVLDEEDSLAVAAQVHGDVREWQECQVQEVVTPSQLPSPLHLRMPAR